MDTENRGVKLLYLLFDLSLLNISLYLVSRYSIVGDYVDLAGRELYLLHANLSELFAYLMMSPRNYFFTDRYTDRVKEFMKRFLVLFVTLIVLARLMLPGDYYRSFIVEYVGLFFLLKVVVFFVIYRVHYYRYSKGYVHHRTAILGVGDCSLLLGKLLKNNPALGFKMVGYISNGELAAGVTTLGELQELGFITEQHRLNMLFVTDPLYFTRQKTSELLSLCNDTGIRLRYILMQGYWSPHINRKVEPARYFGVYNPQEIPLDSLSRRLLKRLFDLLFSAAVILLLFSWLFPLLALLIKLDSRGPVFFLQQRTGINNKTFTCYKFRTMRVNSESDSKQAEVNDSRITRLGHFLRKSNIDELPQFVNVLLGQMSVVGPRPHMLKHTEQYSALIPHYRVRHFVKPGITGWAQVNGYRGLTDEVWKMEKRVAYDMEYLERWNFFRDIRIIFLTLFGSSSYENAL